MLAAIAPEGFLFLCAGSSIVFLSIAMVIVLGRMMWHIEKTQLEPLRTLERVIESMRYPDPNLANLHSEERRRTSNPTPQTVQSVNMDLPEGQMGDPKSEAFDYGMGS